MWPIAAFINSIFISFFAPDRRLSTCRYLSVEMLLLVVSVHSCLISGLSLVIKLCRAERRRDDATSVSDGKSRPHLFRGSLIISPTQELIGRLIHCLICSFTIESSSFI